MHASNPPREAAHRTGVPSLPWQADSQPSSRKQTTHNYPVQTQHHFLQVAHPKGSVSVATLLPGDSSGEPGLTSLETVEMGRGKSCTDRDQRGQVLRIICLQDVAPPAPSVYQTAEINTTPPAACCCRLKWEIKSQDIKYVWMSVLVNKLFLVFFPKKSRQRMDIGCMSNPQILNRYLECSKYSNLYCTSVFTPNVFMLACFYWHIAELVYTAPTSGIGQCETINRMAELHAGVTVHLYKYCSEAQTEQRL